MRLIIVSPSFYPATHYGGPIYSLFNFSKCLAKNGISVSVSTTNSNGKNKLGVKVNKYLELDANIFVKYYSSWSQSGFSLRMFLSLWKDIKGKDIIYLVSIFSPPTPLVLFLNIFFRKPLILSPRGQLGEWCLKQGNILKKAWLKIFVRPISNRITWEATSESEKEMIKKVYPAARVEVIPSIINVEEFEEQSMKRNCEIYTKLIGKDFTGKRMLISMGRLHKVKGFNILIEAMNKVHNEDSALLIAGEDFGERKNLKNLIDKLGLKEKVFLVGMIEGEDKKEFLRNADIFALASHHENFGIVYAEALASGIPIIASKNTPWQNVVKYNCGKWINNLPEEFANSIEELLTKDLKQLGENGRKYIAERFSCNTALKKYRALFNSILN